MDPAEALAHQLSTEGSVQMILSHSPTVPVFPRQKQSQVAMSETALFSDLKYLWSALH